MATSDRIDARKGEPSCAIIQACVEGDLAKVVELINSDSSGGLATVSTLVLDQAAGIGRTNVRKQVNTRSEGSVLSQSRKRARQLSRGIGETQEKLMYQDR